MKHKLVHLSSLTVSILNFNFKNGLVGLKDHAIVHFIVFVEIQPCSIRAGFPIDSVCQNPSVLLGAESHA